MLLNIKNLLLLVVLSVLSTYAWATDKSSNSVVQECFGCHTKAREIVEGLFPSGFHQWKDTQCYGCHAEFVEIAKNKVAGHYDPRQTSLPIREKRLDAMAIDRPLPYLNANMMPLKSTDKNRISHQGLLSFLRRPFGVCQNNSCSAPQMMAYPNLTPADIESIFSQFNGNKRITSSGENRRLNAALGPSEPDDLLAESLVGSLTGNQLFTSKCASCHQDGQVSGYDQVGLSLFSAQWIFNYANGLSGDKSKRRMPVVNITTAEANKLAKSFSLKRQQQEALVDNSYPEIARQYAQLPTKTTPKALLNYIWKSFWRDGGCIHCHGIEGRAKLAFESTQDGLKTWLAKNDAMALYQRLAIKKYEEKYAMAAHQSGMPMTGSPLPDPLIQMIGIWIKGGCQDLMATFNCVKKD